MHYMIHRSHHMQKHKFGVTCPDALFAKTATGPPKYEKKCINISCPGCTEMHYVTHRFHRIQKHKFNVTCPGALFMEKAPGPPDHENYASSFTPQTHQNDLVDRMMKQISVEQNPQPFECESISRMQHGMI
jgi:hypothetical protein